MTGHDSISRSTAPDSAYPSLGRARFNQCVLAAIGFFTMLDVHLVGLLVEPIKHDLGMTDTQVGFAQATAFYVAFAACAIPMGVLVDRKNRVLLTTGAMVLWCVGLVMVALSRSSSMLAFAKMLMGVANAMTYPAAMSLLADSFPPQRRSFAIASFGIGQSLGQVGALLMGGLSYSALEALVATNPAITWGLAPWRVICLLFAGLGVLLIPLLLNMKEPARIDVKLSDTGTLRDLWSYRSLLIPLFLGIMFLSGMSSGIALWVAPALMRLYQLTPGDFAVPYSAIALTTGMAGLLIGSTLVNVAQARGQSRQVMRPAYLAAALAAPATCMALMPSWPGFALTGTVFLLCVQVAISIPVITINLAIPNHLRGLTMGVYTVLFAAAGAISPPLVGYASDVLGGSTMIGIAIALVGVAFGLLAACSFWRASRATFAGAG
jgi:MFS family permease